MTEEELEETIIEWARSDDTPSDHPKVIEIINLAKSGLKIRDMLDKEYCAPHWCKCKGNIMNNGDGSAHITGTRDKK